MDGGGADIRQYHVESINPINTPAITRMSCSVIATFICFGTLNEEGGSATADIYLIFKYPKSQPNIELWKIIPRKIFCDTQI